MYAGKTTKTLTRDINQLVTAGLLAREGNAVRPRIETMLAFLPLRAEAA
jgi:DNA-binding HxlR family transcriptional regulator